MCLNIDIEIRRNHKSFGEKIITYRWCEIESKLSFDLVHSVFAADSTGSE